MKQAARLRGRCLAVVTICALLGMVRAADATIPFFHPSVSTPWRVNCVYSLCEWRMDILQGLPPAVQTADSERPEVIARLKEVADVPRHRCYLVLAELVRLVPELLFLFSLALGFRHLGKGEVFGRRTITWLRRAAMAALLAALAQPVTMFIQMFVLLTPLTGTLGANMVSVYIPAGEVIAALFFASAAWVVAFALDAGRRKQDELAGYV